MRKKKFSIILLTLVLLSSFASNALAYNYLGGHYDHTSISFKMDSSVYTSPSYQYYNSVSDGATSWNAGTPLYVYSSSGTTDITYYAYDSGNTGWNAITYNYPGYTGDSNHIYTGCDISLNRYYMNAYGVTKRQAIVAHETGHALGLAHNTTDPKTLMYYAGSSVYYDEWGIMSPQTDEKNGINNLYAF